MSAKGAWVYLAAWDVRRAKIFGRRAHRNGIQHFDGLIGEVMDQEPYRSAKRMFWIIDNCSVHRGRNPLTQQEGVSTLGGVQK